MWVNVVLVAVTCTLWLFNIAMGHGSFIEVYDDLPVKYRLFQSYVELAEGTCRGDSNDANPRTALPTKVALVRSCGLRKHSHPLVMAMENSSYVYIYIYYIHSARISEKCCPACAGS